MTTGTQRRVLKAMLVGKPLEKKPENRTDAVDNAQKKTDWSPLLWGTNPLTKVVVHERGENKKRKKKPIEHGNWSEEN